MSAAPTNLSDPWLTPQAALDRVGRHYHAGGAVLIATDYDGTLCPIAERPDLAHLPPVTRQTLADLAALPRLRVAVISGRALADVRALVGLEGLDYAGSAGSQLWLDGRHYQPPGAEAAAPLIEAAHQALQSWACTVPGCWVEIKPLALTVHYRAVAPPRQPEIALRARAILGEVISRLTPPTADASLPGVSSATANRPVVALRFHDGPLALEIFADLGWTKATALRKMSQHMADAASRERVSALVGSGGTPHGAPLIVYAGDADNDRDALTATRDLGGLPVAVGPTAPHVGAGWQCPDTANWAHWLARLANLLRESHA